MKMKYKKIDLENYERRGQFELFRSYANPYAGITMNVDITALLPVLREKGHNFFFTVLYCTSQALNSVPEFRRRIVGDELVEYEHCDMSYTLMTETGAYCYCEESCEEPYEEFLQNAQEHKLQALQKKSFDDGEDPNRLCFVSSLPWLSFTDIQQPLPQPADSIPRITWGKYFEQNRKILLPYNITFNHALADGVHAGRFFEELNKQISSICE